MKATDCTPEQIESAEQWLHDRGWPVDAEVARVNRQQMARLVAWYGALRFQAGRDGIGGTFERPGILDVVKPKEPQR